MVLRRCYQKQLLGLVFENLVVFISVLVIPILNGLKKEECVVEFYVIYMPSLRLLKRR